ncbi:amino acid ABC transporter permease [Clostridium sp. DL1XJH146]
MKILQALPLTLEITIVAMVVGLLIGIIVATIRLFKVKYLSPIADFYVSFVRGTPLLLQLLLVYYAIPLVFDNLAAKNGWAFRSNQIPIIVFALIAYSINAGAYMSEIIRSGIMAVEPGQLEACHSVGMTTPQALKRIILPQALGISIPMLCSMLIELLKGSSIAFTISLVEITGMAKASATKNYNFLEAYIACAIMYWMLCILIEKASVVLEKKVNIYNKGGLA